jgi:hypothetical protein
MTLQTSGQITLDDIHVEAGGTTDTEASINDSDIRGIANSIPSSHSPMPFSFWYGAPFSLGSWPTGAGSVKEPTLPNVSGYDRNGDGIGEATFEFGIKHDTANNRIEFRQKKVQGLNRTTFTYDYYTYTGNVLDNINNDLADWEFKAEWNVTETDNSSSSFTTTFRTPNDNGFSSGTWYNISTSLHSPSYEWTVTTTDPVNISEIDGTVTFYIRCTKAGIVMPFTTGFDDSGLKTLDVYANAGDEVVIEP